MNDYIACVNVPWNDCHEHILFANKSSSFTEDVFFSMRTMTFPLLCHSECVGRLNMEFWAEVTVVDVIKLFWRKSRFLLNKKIGKSFF